MLTPCNQPGCPTPVTRGRCPPHQHAHEKQRGTAHQRGYDAQHQHTRRRLLPAAIGQPCPICGHTMTADQPLDLDHSNPLATTPDSRGDRITHAACNRGWRRTTPPGYPPHRI